jgi:hypothetical protein
MGPRCSLSIGRPHLDAYVEKMVLHRISPDDWQRMRKRRASTPALPVIDTAALEARVVELAEDYAMKRITRREWDAARTALMGRLADAEAELEAAEDDDDDVDLPDVADLHRGWREDRSSRRSDSSSAPSWIGSRSGS